VGPPSAPQAPEQRRTVLRGSTAPWAIVGALGVLTVIAAGAAIGRARGVASHAHGASGASPGAAATVATAASAGPGTTTGIGAPRVDANGEVGEKGARMLHGDRRRTHRAQGLVPRTPPRVLWTYEAGGSIEAQVTTSPDEQTLYVVSLDGTITALTREGAKSWSTSLGDRVYSTPCVADDGTIYVGSDASRFVALSPEGRVLWKLDTDGEADTGAAIAADGRIVFAAGKTLYAVRARGGGVAYKTQAKRKIFTSPALAADGTAFFGAQDHRAYAVAPSGAVAWSVDLGADVDGSPAIADDGAIYVGTDAGEVVRLRPNDGEVEWRAKLGGYVRGALAIARNGDVLAGVYGPTPRQVRIEPGGALRGAFDVQGTGAREFGVHGGALEDDAGTLLFGAQDDMLRAVDSAGALLWRFETAGDVDAPATLLSDGSIVVASDDGKVRLLVP
jgi:outer membrane protein assembly factor BamB